MSQPAGRPYSRRRFKIVVGLLALVSAVAFYAATRLIIHYFRFSHMIELRLSGERWERPTRVYARPYLLHRGQLLSPAELIQLLNGLGYRETATAEQPGTFRVKGKEIHLRLRPSKDTGGARSLEAARVLFENDRVAAIQDLKGRSWLQVELEPEPVTTLFGDERAKQRWVPLREIPKVMVQAVLATEDRRFFDHTGLDPIGIARAFFMDLREEGPARQGGSTISQQLVKNYFLSPERTLRRKLLEAFLTLILESQVGKQEILELYLNEVYLGQRGSFSIHGIGQAARVYFGKDVRNLSLEEAALIAGLIHSPNSESPFRNPERARARRDTVLGLMARQGFISGEENKAAAERRLELARGSVDVGEAPYFIDLLQRELAQRYSVEALARENLAAYSTLDRYLQNQAQRAVSEGLVEIEGKISNKPKRGAIQAALVAMDPRKGDVLALVGGRSYGASQFNRAVEAHRQPGSTFKPFVYLAAFEYTYGLPGAGETPPQYPLAYLTPATRILDEPTTFTYENKTWTPANYEGRYEGMVSLRQALAHSLNAATAKVGARIGMERVVALWKSMGMASKLQPYPSLVLGAFEMTPLEVATAYAVIASGGYQVKPRLFTAIRDAKGKTIEIRIPDPRRVVHAQSAYLVTDMMRAVVDTGTGAPVRARGFTAPAAGKTGTTNDKRDAWFVGFTPDLLAVVWVGFDDNESLGLSGAQAALPIWTRFMKAATAGLPVADFQAPEGITFATIDPQSGLLARQGCPARDNAPFLEGTEPRATCNLH